MISKTLASIAAFTLVTYAHAADSYDDYESFYIAQPNRLFGEPITQDRNSAYSSPGTEGIFVESPITIDNRKAKIRLGQNYFTLNGKRYLFKNAKAFSKERASDIYPVSADIFTTGGEQNGTSALCIEGYGNGSGEMSRYAQIYLLLNPLSKKREREFLRLPSLLSSCRAVLLDNQGELRFPLNNYMFDAENKNRVGLHVAYYTFKNREFTPTHQELKLQFKTPEVPFQFTVQ